MAGTPLLLVLEAALRQYLRGRAAYFPLLGQVLADLDAERRSAAPARARRLSRAALLQAPLPRPRHRRPAAPED